MSVKLQNIAFGLLCAMPILLSTWRASADIVAMLVTLLFLMHCVMHKDWKWMARPEFHMLAALWIFMMATAPFSAEPAVSFKIAAYWIRYVLFFFAVSTWLLVTPEAIATAAKVALAMLVFIAIDTAWQYVTGTSLTLHPVIGGRLSGPLDHPNIGNVLLKIGLPVFGTILFIYRQRRTAVAVFMLCVMALIFLSGERSITALMLLSSGLVWLLLYSRLAAQRRSLLIFALAAVCMFGTLAATQHVVQARSKMTAEQLGDFQNSPYGQLYRAAMGFFNEHPIIGIGAGEFRGECTAKMQWLSVEYCNVHPHNIYLEWLADTGVVGFVLFVSGIFFIIRRALKESSFTGQSAIPAAFAFGARIVLLFPFVVTQSVFANWPALLFWYSMALAVSLPRLKEAT